MRPRSVTLLALAVFCLSAFNLLGAVSGIQRYTFLTSLPLSAPPLYLILTRALWGLAFAALGVGLWRLKHWGRVGTLVVFSLYVLHGWFNRLAFARSDFSRVNMAWAWGVSLVSLALVWGILMRRKVRQSFHH